MASPTVIDRHRSSERSPSRTAALALGLLLALALGLGLTQASSAHAFELDDFTGTVLRPPSPGDGPDGPHYADLAGEHPDTAIVDFSIKPQDDSGDSEPIGVTRDIRVDIPAGLVPNPAAFPTCTNEQLDNQVNDGIGPVPPTPERCPVASQVGFIELTVRGALPALGGRSTLTVQLPVYNMTRATDQVGRFAFFPAQAPGSVLLEADKSRVDIIGGVRPSDQGLYFRITSPESLPLLRSKLTFWGTPGLATHDADRGLISTSIVFAGTPLSLGRYGDPLPVPDEDRNVSFLTNPTLCAGVLRSTVHVTSYAEEQDDAFFDTPYGAQDCAGVPFDPSVSFASDGPVRPDAAAALKVGIHVPQSPSSDVRGTAQLNDASVTLPEGFSINPSAANGLDTCSDAQLARGSDDPVTCPDAAKVGTVAIDSPVIDSPLEGSIYVGQPQPGQKYRLFLVAEGHGVSIRLQGDVTPDPTTGQVKATFRDNPQLPFSDLDLRFDGGDRGIIASPQTCGSKAGMASLTSFASATPVDRTASIDVTGCDGFPFSPGFGVTTTSQKSGAFSPLSVGFTRADGNQFLSGVSAVLPEGMTAKLKGVQRCAEAQIAAEACPGGAQVGIVSVKAGTGDAPYALNGPVYLTNGYKGGSFGMVAIIHAVAGPYDLGNVVVRQALKIDPETAQVSVVSDPLPQIQDGIPLRLRDLTLNVNRAGFIRNPTSCSDTRLDAQLRSAAGAVATPSSKLTFAGCKDLKFAPQIKLALGNKTQTGKGKNPQFSVVVTQKDGEAGLKATSVALPKALALAADNAQALCETADALADRCPKTSIVGSAVAETPILDKALKGPVYFVKGERKDPKTGNVIKTLPTLFVPLRGETTINLRATTSVNHDRLVTTFPAIPDQPITKFSLKIDGGKHGIIAATRSLCGGKLAGSVRFTGQNGAKPAAAKPAISTACKTTKKTSKK